MKNKARILVVDNDATICWVLQQAFTDEGYTVTVVNNGRDALEQVREETHALVFMDIMMPVMDGLTALKEIRAMTNPPEIIMITAHSSMDSTVEAIKDGAFDYIVKPFDIDEVTVLAEKAIEKYHERQKPAAPVTLNVSDTRIVGDSPPMRELYKLLGRVAPTDSPVLITGETGTGKDLFARAIHVHSDRRDGTFVTVNCAAIPGDLLESELFGHVRGAFTGATEDRKGKCERADGGSLFLDEIGTMRLDLQTKLLRFLQRNEFEPVGSSRVRQVDVRVLAATNADLKKMTEEGTFREDLYYRLMVVPVDIPPLRARREDIPALAKYFVTHYNQKYGLGFKLTDDIVDALVARNWPGNVRELENYIHRMVVLRSDTVEGSEEFVPRMPGQPGGESIGGLIASLVDSGASGLLEKARSRVEKPLLKAVMDRVRENQSEAAKLLGVSRNTLRKMLREYGMLARNGDE